MLGAITDVQSPRGLDFLLTGSRSICKHAASEGRIANQEFCHTYDFLTPSGLPDRPYKHLNLPSSLWVRDFDES